MFECWLEVRGTATAWSCAVGWKLGTAIAVCWTHCRNFRGLDVILSAEGALVFGKRMMVLTEIFEKI